MYAIYMVTFTINIPQMLAHIPYMDPMGIYIYSYMYIYIYILKSKCRKSCKDQAEHQLITEDQISLKEIIIATLGQNCCHDGIT